MAELLLVVQLGKEETVKMAQVSRDERMQLSGENSPVYHHWMVSQTLTPAYGESTRSMTFQLLGNKLWNQL